MNITTLTTGSILLVGLSTNGILAANPQKQQKPNLIYVFADQLRSQALSINGDPNVKDPNIKAFANEAINIHNTFSCVPVSTPYRASMMTGQYALTNGVFVNDVQLNPKANTIGKIYKKAGYETGYIGKWHINGHGRSSYIKPEWRQGFDYFKVLECTHNYMHSAYYDNNDTNKKYWKGYDAIAETKDAISYIKSKANKSKPFVLFLSWGSPHNPYDQQPQKYKDIYKNMKLKLRKNVPIEKRDQAIKWLKGYYAHISALDDCIGMLRNAVKDLGIDENTIFVFTSDHGDQLMSHALKAKQKPYDESICVPFLIRYPNKLGEKGKRSEMILSTPDILPTLLGLSDIKVPKTIEGKDLSKILMGKKKDDTKAALIECIQPFGEWRKSTGGKEYRGLRTRRYTYVKSLNGPWLLYDNIKDPYQLNNLVNKTEYDSIQKQLDKELMKLLKKQGDEFKPGLYYINKWGYKIDKNGTVPYH